MLVSCLFGLPHKMHCSFTQDDGSSCAESKRHGSHGKPICLFCLASTSEGCPGVQALKTQVKHLQREQDQHIKAGLVLLGWSSCATLSVYLAVNICKPCHNS